MTEVPPGCRYRIVNDSDVIINRTAATVVALLNSVLAPRAPNVV